MTPKPGGVPGVEADHPIVDPTKNVLDLVEAANERQDDLRNLITQHTEAMATLREGHQKEIRELESKRVDAVREIDVIARNTASAQALTAIQTLAASTSAEREALRSLVSATATTIAAQTDRIVGAMTDRIAVLEKTSYTGQGKQAVSDPQMEALVSAVNKLTAAGAASTGKSEGLSQGWALLGGAILLALAIYSGVFKSSAAVAPAPQVIYVPSPPGTLLPSSPPAAAPR